MDELKAEYQDLGTIEVRFRRMRTKSHKGEVDVAEPRTERSLDDIPEKIVKGKAISMAARLVVSLCLATLD